MFLSSLCIRHKHKLLSRYSVRLLHSTPYHNTPITNTLNSTDDVRQSFLDYYHQQHAHTVIPSSSLIPHNDSTLLFINAGMAPLKQLFIGTESIEQSRLCGAQLCVRAGGKHNDLDNVGYTRRHHTLFEMLGNYSLYDYYKQYAIESAWNYVIHVLQLDMDRIFITVHENDMEAAQIWSKLTGWSADSNKIRYCNDSDNYWSMGNTGPCGYCSEIYYKLGDINEPDNESNLLEIWNIVFMSHNKTADGELIELNKPCIDTGMGLERITSVLQNKFTNYDIDLFVPIFDSIRDIHDLYADTNSTSTIFNINNMDTTALKQHNTTNYSIGLDQSQTAISMRVMADHIRTITFLIADGIVPSNIHRGYVLRRIIRRAITYGCKLGFHQPFLYHIVPSVVHAMGHIYTHVHDKQSLIQSIIHNEEIQFYSTLMNGMKVLNDKLISLHNTENHILSGSDAFLLYDSFGFPLDMTQLLAKDNNIRVDTDQYELLMKQQRERARSDRNNHSSDNHSILPIDIIKQWQTDGITNEFVGYTELSVPQSRICSITSHNDNIYMVISPTPFYAASGGQIADTGKLINQHGVTISVVDCVNLYDNCTVLCINNEHIDYDITIEFPVDSTVHAAVDVMARQQISIHHTATHLLHSALKHVLSSSSTTTVQQSGSYVGADKLRFDYSYPSSLTQLQLDSIEQYVNQSILTNKSVTTQSMTLHDAQQLNATAIFNEKYNSDNVRVITAGESSIELCGGTHVNNTIQCYPFKIMNDSSAASGIRRIDAVSGPAAVNILNQSYNTMKYIASSLKIPISNVSDRILGMNQHINQLNQQLIQYKYNNRHDTNTTISTDYQGTDTLIHILPDNDTVDNNILRTLTDELCKSAPTVIHIIVQNSTGIIALSTDPRTTHTSMKQTWLILGKKINSQYTAKGGGNDKLVLGVLIAIDNNKQRNLAQLLADTIKQM